MRCWCRRWWKSYAAGGIVWEQKQSDFVVADGSVPQKIHVQEELDTAPVALVVAMEEGKAETLEFQKLTKLGGLLDVFLSNPHNEAALVGFGSKPRLMQDYTHSGELAAGYALELNKSDGRAAILDTISWQGSSCLEDQQKEIIGAYRTFSQHKSATTEAKTASLRNW